MPQVQLTLSEETYKAIKHILADEGGNVRAFCVAAVEDAVKRRDRARTHGIRPHVADERAAGATEP